MPTTLSKLPWMALKLFSLTAFQILTGIANRDYTVSVLNRYICLAKRVTVTGDKYSFPVDNVATEWVTKQGLYTAAAIHQVSKFYPCCCSCANTVVCRSNFF